jgi:hypothetical protein
LVEEKAMSQGDHYSVFNPQELEAKLPFIMKAINGWDFSSGLVIKIERYQNPRSISQNALFHVWCRTMSKHFIEKIPTATPENMKLMMKNRFLGTEDIKVGKEIIKGQVKHSSSLTKGEMVHFLDNVYHWAHNHDLILESDADSEYQKLKRQQDE